MAASRTAQRAQVKDALEAARMRLGDTYYVVSQKWWASWRQYVGYDQGLEGSLEQLSVSGSAAAEPGPVGNEPLSFASPEGDRFLKVGLVEHDDYALVPAPVWAALEGWYGGGPAYPVRVVRARRPRRSTSRSTRCASTCASWSATAARAPRTAARPVLCSRYDVGGCGTGSSAGRGGLGDERRIWVRAAAEEDFTGESVAGEPRELREDRFWGRGGDDAQGEELWQLLEGDESAMIGGVPAVFGSREAPRWGALAGDVVDARDSEGRWFDSVVVEVDGSKVKVHFRGWSSRWDTWVEKEDQSSLQPLFARTEDWRRLRVGDACEVRSEDAKKPLWYEARVVDCSGDRVEVSTVALAPPLQCLSHTHPLTNYFLEDDGNNRPTFLDEINEDNPLGAGGQIARAYADFVRDVWSGKFAVVVPTALKRSIGTHAPQFSGYQQQDSQELMNYVLDGLHEDLNRIKRKPYTETLESNGRPDAEVSRESWSRFQMRNKSVIVDTCYGQLKSHITCPNCNHESITFDPYLSLSLPLPAAKTRRVAVTLLKLPLGTRPLKLVVAVPARETVGALKDALVALAYGADARSGGDLDLCDVWGHRVYRTFADAFSVEHIKPNDELVAFELDRRGANGKPKGRTVDVLFGKVAAARVAAHCARFVASGDGNAYRCCASTASGTRFESDLGAEAEALPSTVQTVTLEWSDEDLAGRVDAAERDAVDDHASARRRDDDGGRGAASIDVLDCFRKLAEREQLGETEQWYCAKCKQHSRAFKKLDLWSVPDVLILHLKRFQYAQNTYFVHRQKLDDLVSFPLRDLDLSSQVLGAKDDPRGCLYDLYAVSEHSGGLGGGHYTATAIDDATQVW
ncbi:ubiquitinyl hydrolase [Aureococcus anophagefferens]|nr:ubiquitinyl hydrolase [Aureococcus anophagefferens]